jgi:hypothetical protein
VPGQSWSRSRVVQLHASHTGALSRAPAHDLQTRPASRVRVWTISGWHTTCSSVAAMKHFYGSVIAATFLVVIASSAQAQPAERFGEAGVIAISSDAAFSIRDTHISGGPTAFNFVLEPAADFFVIRGLSVGGFIGIDYAKSGDSHSTRFGIGPRVGYNVGLSDLLSLWPRVGFSYAHTSISGGGVGSGNAMALNFFVPLMLHPAEHFFAGFGPFLDVDTIGDNKATSFGAKLTLGGWVD